MQLALQMASGWKETPLSDPNFSERREFHEPSWLRSIFRSSISKECGTGELQLCFREPGRGLLLDLPLFSVPPGMV
jgi:hypothetical protein